MSQPIKVELTTVVTFTADRINDLLCCALEGGSNYWYLIVDEDLAGAKFYHEAPSRGGRLTFAACGDDGEYDFAHGGDTRFTLDWHAVERGLRVMAAEYPRHMATFLAENEDAETGDVFLQCCLFGELIFG